MSCWVLFVGPIWVCGALRNRAFRHCSHFRSPLWRSLSVNLDRAHHCCLPGWSRGRLWDKVHPGLPLLSERRGGALRCHRTDGGGERIAGYCRSCGRIWWWYSTLKERKEMCLRYLYVLNFLNWAKSQPKSVFYWVFFFICDIPMQSATYVWSTMTTHRSHISSTWGSRACKLISVLKVAGPWRHQRH